MKEYIPLLSSLGVLVSGLVLFGRSFFKNYREKEANRTARVQKAEANLAGSQNQLIEVHRLEADAWKTRYIGEHEELLAYRLAQHAKAQEFNNQLLEITTKNAELTAKTDLTPILKHHQDQSAINLKVMEGMDKVMQALGSIIASLEKKNGHHS